MRYLTASATLIALTASLSTGAQAQDKPVNQQIEDMRKRLEEAGQLLLKKQQEMQGRAGASAGGAAGKSKDTAKGGAGGEAGKKSAKGGGGGTATKRELDAPKAPDQLAELDKTRDLRRQATVARIRERWGSLVENSEARAELGLHAERLARLSRIRSLAEEAKKLALIESVDALLTKEELRHGRVMNALRTASVKP